MRNNLFTLVALLVSFSAVAQDKANALEGTFFDSGKIWVVVAVAGIILLGIFAYLFKMDKALRKLEEEVKSK